MTTLTEFMPSLDKSGSPVSEHPLKRIQRLAREAGIKQVAQDLEEEIHQVDKGRHIRDPVFRAGQPVWWFPTAENRPAFMVRTQRMIAASVKSQNQERRTVLIEYHDATRKTQKFLVNVSELVKREIPR
jgi:hypothetical protein